jgi:hypothetical protein
MWLINSRVCLSVLLPVSFLFVLNACKQQKKAFSVEELHLGQSHISTFEKEKGDSAKYLPPQPPPPPGDIWTLNIFEGDAARVYYYEVYYRKMCGFMSDDTSDIRAGESKLKELKKEDVRPIFEFETDSILRSAAACYSRENQMMVSIGIQDSTSCNPILIKLVNELYHNSTSNIWKVRKVRERELELAKQEH